MPGDYNHDGQVNAADYTLLATGVGSYAEWQANFGHTGGITLTQPTGYYVMQAVDKQNVSDTTISNPVLSGFHVRSSWSSGFAFLDAQVARASRLGKQVTLGVYAGTSGHQPVGWTWTDFDNMVKTEGVKYATNPTVVAVHISCPDTVHSMEMFPPAGIPTQTLLTDWEHSIDDYNAAFPNKALVLDIAPSPVTQAVINYAEQKLGQRFNPIMDSLHATTNTGYSAFQQVKAGCYAGYNCGFEMVSPSINQTRFGGTFSQAISIGSAAGAHWYQVYQQDVGSIRQTVAVPEPSTTELIILGLLFTCAFLLDKRKEA